ncbi:MAG TPA: hypothetical protein VIX84_01670 [Acidimicrobiales bacterium]
MKHHRYRLFLAGVLALATVSLPLSVPFAESLIGAGTAAADSSTLANPDVITYTQASTGTTVTYAPYGGTSTTQTLTPTGRCGTPTVTPAATPILGMTGLLYASDKDTAGQPDYDSVENLGAPTTVPVGSYKQQTGVCSFPLPSWAIANGGFFGEQALEFTTVGTNTLDQTPGCTTNCGRTFLDAQISLERQSRSSAPSIPVELVEYLGGTKVASQTCTITGGVGTTITADTNTNAVCPGTTALTGFDTVEIGLPVDGAAVSVVTTSTFELAPQVCGGGSVSTPAGSSATATLQLNNPGGCESYTGFSSNAAGNALTYNEYSAGNPQPFTVTIQWAPVADCQPGTDPAADPPQFGGFSLPQCPVTEFLMNGVTYYDQSFCSSPTSTPAPLCTQNKDFNYKSVNGVDETFITEVWVGDIDWNIRI